MNLDLIAKPPDDLAVDGHWIVVRDGHVLIEAGVYALPFGAAPPIDIDASVTKHFLGVIEGHGVWGIDVDADVEPPDWYEFVHLRSLYGRIPEHEWVAAGRAEQIVQWDKTHQFCGRCGTQTHHHPDDRARECPDCQLLAYPRLAPAVIMLVEREDKILLAQGRRFEGRFFSTLAGFVEAGESLEQAVHREVGEEVGIQIADVTYFKSQPWPFPHSLMVGFTAKYVSGEIVPQEEEIVEAGWFGPDELPPCPMGGMSIAGWLIQDWLDKNPGN